MNFKKLLRSPILIVVLAIVVVSVGFSLITGSGYKTITTQHGLELIQDGKVASAKIIDGEQRVDLTLASADGDNGTMVQFNYVAQRGGEIVSAITTANPAEGFDDQVPQPSWLLSAFSILLPLLLIGFFIWIMFSGMQGGGNRVMQFGKSKAKLASKDSPKVTFADVAGSDEAIEELEEIKDFLKEPAKFQAVGARIPKGVLLYGPPGTGKTLLARAVAGEAGVPFYSISGSDFVEMFVGVGASRVRDLFEQAKQNAPAIIFVDEIDAVGRHRGAGVGGGNDEREQTLNQLLVEMDGFDVKTNVILIAATNRPDVLDPALLRPGRFDRQIGVDAPDLQGRKQILEVHGRGKPLAAGVDLEVLARKTPGFSGADLANVLNEAALLTARSNAQLIDDPALDEAVDRVMAGPQRRSRIMRDHEKLITAYHEGGHALAAAAMNNTDPVTKVTILPRGRALGYTMVLPLEDKNSVTRNELLDQLAYAMGGRVAEEIVFHAHTTGASNDIEKATSTRASHGHRGRHERQGRIREARLQLGRAVPRSRPRRQPGLRGGHGPDARRRGARAPRRRARRGVAGHQRQPRRARPPRHRAPREGDARPRPARGDLRGRQEAAAAPAVALERQAPALGPAARGHAAEGAHRPGRRRRRGGLGAAGRQAQALALPAPRDGLIRWASTGRASRRPWPS